MRHKAFISRFSLAILFLGLIQGNVLFSAPVARAEEKIDITVVLSSGKKPFAEAFEGFREYLNHRQIPVDYRIVTLPKDSTERAELMTRIGRRKVDLFFAIGSAALEFAGNHVPETPILAGMILRETDFQLVPGSTGVYLEFSPETQFEWLKRILPEAKNVGVVYGRRENRQRVEAAAHAAEEAGLTLHVREVDDARELPSALSDLATRVDVLWGISDEVVLTPQTARNILLFSFRQRIPFIGLSTAWVKAGAFYALDRDYHDIGRQCGKMALSVLAEKQLDAILPQRPRKLVYSVNLKAARQMKIDLPTTIIHNADEVF